MIIRTRNLAPIVVYVYNRPEHFRKCILALAASPLASKSELYVVSDGAKCAEHQAEVDQVREIALSAKGFFKVHPMFRETNWGVYASITTADREVIENHGRMICLDDDVIAAPSFLEFINSGLDYFANDQRIFSVTGYCHPISFPADYTQQFWLSLVSAPWGYGTWKDRYIAMDPSWNPLPEIKKNWAVYVKTFRYCTFLLSLLEDDARGLVTAIDARISGQMMLKQQFTVFPTVSRTKNIGLDGSGLHCGFDPLGDGVILDNELSEVVFSDRVGVDYRIIKALNVRISSPIEPVRAVLNGLGLMEFARWARDKLKLFVPRREHPVTHN